MIKNKEQKEKEKQARLKELRRELEEKLEDHFLPELSKQRPAGDAEAAKMEDCRDPVLAKRVIEALLFASSRPLSVTEIRKVLKTLKPSEVEKYIQELATEYHQTGRSFEIRQIAGGFEVATRKEYAPWLIRLEHHKKVRQATQSALETLAILAYKQPVTRAEIEELRGVDVSGVINTLMGRGLIKIVGRKEVPGRPFLYGTTEKFLEHFGLKDLSELPDISEIRTWVENSVRKEELFQNPKIVQVGEELQESGGLDVAGTETEVSPEAKNDGREKKGLERESHESEPAPQEN